jgi:hypothetical protein
MNTKTNRYAFTEAGMCQLIYMTKRSVGEILETSKYLFPHLNNASGLFPAITLTSLQVFPIVPASSIILLQLLLGLPLLLRRWWFKLKPCFSMTGESLLSE